FNVSDFTYEDPPPNTRSNQSMMTIHVSSAEQSISQRRGAGYLGTWSAPLRLRLRPSVTTAAAAAIGGVKTLRRRRAGANRRATPPPPNREAHAPPLAGPHFLLIFLSASRAAFTTSACAESPLPLPIVS